MADWNNPQAIQVWYRYQSDGNIYSMPGRIDMSGQPILPGLNHQMMLYGKRYVVDNIVWAFGADAEPAWDRTYITVNLKVQE